MTSRSGLVVAFGVIAPILLGCGGNSSSSALNAGRGAAQAGHVRAARAVVDRKPSLELRVKTRTRVVESLISAADLAGRNDWRGFDRAIADTRRAIHRYRQSTGGDTIALSDAESLAETVDNVIALASYDGTVPDIDVEMDADADVDVDALTSAVTDAIAAAAKTSLPAENPQR